MSDNAAVGYAAIALSVATAIYSAVNHKRVRSNCCGKLAEVSLDVENTTPPNQRPPPEAPTTLTIRPPTQ